jgi:glycosyltransferase involved in cell wall biosynthesis
MLDLQLFPHCKKKGESISMPKEIVSIVMAMHNTAQYVRDAIDSALRQDYPYFELLIVDDGSTDGGHEIVLQYSDPRLRLIRTENRGLSAARNRGVDESNGSFVTFLDSDDLLTPFSISSRLYALQQTGAEVAFSRNILSTDISCNSNSLHFVQGDDYFSPCKSWETVDLICSLIQGTFFVFSQAMIINRNLYQKIGGHDPLIHTANDVEFISRLLPATKIFAEALAPIYVYRRRHNSMSAITSRRRAGEMLGSIRKYHRNLAPYVAGHEEQLAQSLFRCCAQCYPFWTDDHRLAVLEARRVLGHKPFELSCVGGPKSQAVAQLFGWRAGRLTNFAGNYLKSRIPAFSAAKARIDG